MRNNTNNHYHHHRHHYYCHQQQQYMLSLSLFYFKTALGQPTGLSKEVCLYEGADWLKLIIQSEGGEGSLEHNVN